MGFPGRYGLLDAGGDHRLYHPGCSPHSISVGVAPGRISCLIHGVLRSPALVSSRVVPFFSVSSNTAVHCDLSQQLGSVRDIHCGIFRGPFCLLSFLPRRIVQAASAPGLSHIFLSHDCPGRSVRKRFRESNRTSCFQRILGDASWHRFLRDCHGHNSDTRQVLVGAQEQSVYPAGLDCMDFLDSGTLAEPHAWYRCGLLFGLAF